MQSTNQKRVLVSDLTRGTQRPLIKKDPVKTSNKIGFDGFLLEKHRLQEHENIDVAATNTLLAVHLSSPIKVEIRDEGPFRNRIFSPGDIMVFPAGVQYSCRFKGDSEFMVMSLNNDVITRAAQAITDRGDSGLRLNWGIRDPFVRQTMANLEDLCDTVRTPDRIYGETLANSLAMHLVRNSKQMNGHFGSNHRGLSRAQLGRVLDFIHGTPYSDISLRSMAAAASLSPFHFSRMFKVATGVSPHQYVLRRRIEIGAEMLLSRPDSIASIALELGFADQSHFTMHFKRIHGIGPAGYRRQHRR